MRRLIITAIALGVLAWAAPADAITNGTADENGHPNVGGLVAAQAYSDGTWVYCSGTLIAPRVFLTAAHCGEGDRVRVTFDSAYQAGDKVVGDGLNRIQDGQPVKAAGGQSAGAARPAA